MAFGRKRKTQDSTAVAPAAPGAESSDATPVKPSRTRGAKPSKPTPPPAPEFDPAPTLAADEQPAEDARPRRPIPTHDDEW